MKAILEEQIEAAQNSVNQEQEATLKELLPEDAAKYNAIGSACKILTDAKVPFLLIPITPIADGKVMPRQYNNFQDLFAKFDEAGKLLLKSRLAGVLTTTWLISGITHFINVMMNGNAKAPNDYFAFIHSNMIDFQKLHDNNQEFDEQTIKDFDLIEKTVKELLDNESK